MIVETMNNHLYQISMKLQNFRWYKKYNLYPLILKNFEALYFSSSTFSRYGFYIPLANFLCSIKKYTKELYSK